MLFEPKSLDVGLQHHIIKNKMIDLTAKSQMGANGERLKKNKAMNQKKHDAINLPRNLIDSDSEEYEENSSSDDDNHDFYYNEESDITGAFVNMVLHERQTILDEAYRKLVALITKHKQDVEKLGLRPRNHWKARSPFRNKLLEHKKNTQYDLQNRKDKNSHDLTVTTPHGNGGRVFVNNVQPESEVEPFEFIEDESFKTLCEAVEDPVFLSSITKLNDDEFFQLFERLRREEEEEERRQKQSLSSPTVRTVRTMSPVTSPSSQDLYDSSYETGSPCSTVVTSPGGFSPPRMSISSESDQEVDSGVEVHQPRTNIVIIKQRRIPIRNELTTMKPLGEVVSFPQTSATERLEELHYSTKFCNEQFAIQLVRVVMSTTGKAVSDQVEGFCKSLLSVMKIKLGNRAHEGDTWQLSILAHIQYLLARIEQYGLALQRRDERGHSVLYIAAVEQYKKPVIARYIAESMIKVGYNPLDQVDEKGNTIIHTLAELGDTHVHVLGELMMACGPHSAAVVNKARQTPLHVAVQSPNNHLTTVLVLLRMKANPFQQDSHNMTSLHYHIKHMSRGKPRMLEDMELVKKMLQAPVSLDKDSLQSLDLLRADPSIPDDLNAIIMEEVTKYCVKDLRPKKIERR